MKFIIWTAVIILTILFFFPEVQSSLRCIGNAGSFDYINGVCDDIGESFCNDELGGEFMGCHTECREDVLSLRKCEASCFGSCQTETFQEKWGIE